jgi:hypothetical protein
VTLEQILGPFALTIAAVLAVAALWRDHLRADNDDRAMRDRALGGWEAQTSATNRLADALEQQARDHAERRRITD